MQMRAEHSGHENVKYFLSMDLNMKRNRNVQNLIEYFADMFRPSGALGGSGHKQIRGSGWQKLWPMADMALAPEIMADASHPGSIVTRGHLL